VTVRVCESIACHLAGSSELLSTLQDRLGKSVRVLPAPCVGRCDRAPVALVGRNPVDHATPARVEETVLDARTEPELPQYIDYAAYRALGGYGILAECVAGRRQVEEVTAAVEASGLRGLGGAGFPAGRKWAFVRAETPPRYAVLNADEGEPGTFKDRVCFETDPHRVLEGLLIAAWAVEAAEVFIYLRDEYAAVRALLTRELDALNADPPCALPRIQLRRGAGAYICGEETSLIESIEGKRGEPRLRPPFPAQFGVFGRPTLVHNVETVYWLPAILRDGAEAFAARGTRERKGARLFSVSGRVAKPGVYLAPNGVSARELIERAGGMLPGHEFYAYLPGGASGGILPAALGDLALDFDVLAQYGCFIGSAAVVILSKQDRARDAALNLMRFFAHESCGKCTPCRAGTAKSVDLMEQPRWNIGLLGELGRAMSDASICGLGQAAPNPVRCVQQFFASELEP
jgi:formate dehydrogenase